MVRLDRGEGYVGELLFHIGLVQIVIVDAMLQLPLMLILTHMATMVHVDGIVRVLHIQFVLGGVNLDPGLVVVRGVSVVVMMNRTDVGGMSVVVMMDRTDVGGVSVVVMMNRFVFSISAKGTKSFLWGRSPGIAAAPRRLHSTVHWSH